MVSGRQGGNLGRGWTDDAIGTESFYADLWGEGRGWLGGREMAEHVEAEEKVGEAMGVAGPYGGV